MPDNPFKVDVVAIDGQVMLIMSEPPKAKIGGHDVCAFQMDANGARRLAALLHRNADRIVEAALQGMVSAERSRLVVAN